MFLALIIAEVSSRWCLAHVPVILRGRIFPLSVMYPLRTFKSL